MDYDLPTPKLDHDYNPATDSAKALFDELVYYTQRISNQHLLTLAAVDGVEQTLMANDVMEGMAKTQRQLAAFFGTKWFVKVAVHKVWVFKKTTVPNIPQLIQIWMKDYGRIIHGWICRYVRLDTTVWVTQNQNLQQRQQSFVEQEVQDMELDSMPEPNMDHVQDSNSFQEYRPAKRQRTFLDSDAHLWRAINKLADQVALLQTRKGGA
jgi:hypothetical protein